MTTNESEALVRTFDDGYAAAVRAGGNENTRVSAGVEAVAAAVRAQDAARGGTLTAEEVEDLLGSVESAHGSVAPLRAHLAAQGRTIAALEECRSLLGQVIGLRYIVPERGEHPAHEPDHAATQAIWTTLQDRAAATARAIAAESALATLRQAVEGIVQQVKEADAIHNAHGRFPFHAKASMSVWRGIVDAYDASPSEHTDTAKDSGPSRVGEACATCEDEFPSQCGHGAPTPPDVAASEPTPDEDWRKVEEVLAYLRDTNKTAWGGVLADDGASALARLKDEPRRAAEAMRERCAGAVTAEDVGVVKARIRDLPL